MKPVTRDEYNAMVANEMREVRDFQPKVIRLAQHLGWMIYHTYNSQRSNPGWPDLVLSHPKQKRTIFRELKTMRGKVSPKQREWIETLTASGLDADVWRPIHLLDGTIEETLTPNTQLPS